MLLVQFRHRPGSGNLPTRQFVTLDTVFRHVALSHVSQQQGAAGGQPGVAELSVDTLRGRHLKLVYHLAVRDGHDHHLGGLAVLYEQHMLAPDGLDGVNLRARRRFVTPQHVAVGSRLADAHLANAILMSHEHRAFARRAVAFQQHSVADLATPLRITPLPDHLSALDDIHTLLLAFTGIEEVVACQTPVDNLLC